MQYTKSALVAHAHQATQSEFQDHGALKGHKVPDVFQQEKLWPVVVTVTENRKCMHDAEASTWPKGTFLKAQKGGISLEC